MKAFVFGALPVKELPLVPQKNDRVIACDAGLETVRQWGLSPHEVVGDFDSLGYVPREATAVLPVRKDDTDVGFVLNRLWETGIRQVVCYGCLGGALDHTLANVQLAADFSRKGGRLLMIGDNDALCCVSDSTLLLQNGSGRLSVLALTPATGVTLNGVAYPLHKAGLTPWVPLGVSNEIMGDQTEIAVQNGTLAVLFGAKTVKNVRLFWNLQNFS